MTQLWLIVNRASGSFDETIIERVLEAAQRSGGTLANVIALPDDDLPTREALEAAGVDMLAIYTGDGTINGTCAKIGEWGGRVLVLPGGTMNLLSRRLHGEDADPAEIVARALAAPDRTQPVTVLESDDPELDVTGLVGAFVGPTTAWGDVREVLRHRDIGGLLEAIPRAVRETFGGDQVFVAGSDQTYPAIYVEPVDGKLDLMGYSADGAGDLLSHGFAWMGGDFRNGPHDDLGSCTEVTIDSEAGTVGLLVDGERGEAATPLVLRARTSPLRFVATRSGASASA